MCTLTIKANKLATLTDNDKLVLMGIETRYGVEVKNATSAIMTALNAQSAVDVLMCEVIYTATNGIASKSKNSKEEKTNLKDWSDIVGIEYTKISKMRSVYIDVIAQIPYTEILDKDTAEIRNKYITSFKYNQLVELINCKYKFIAYAFKNYSDKLPNIKIFDLRFIFTNMKNGSEFGKMHDDVDIINDFEERINWILDGNKPEKFGITEEDTTEEDTTEEDTTREDTTEEDTTEEDTTEEDTTIKNNIKAILSADIANLAKFATENKEEYLELVELLTTKVSNQIKKEVKGMNK